MRLGIILLFLSSFICFLQAQEIVRESVNQIASSSTMKELALFYKFYRTGKYSQALKELKKLEGRPRIRGNLPYFRGMCYKKLQQYDEAIEEFKKAIQNGDRTKGIFYEYGQALYANNELERARKAFDLSFKRNYKAPFSLYYMAQIASIIEDASATKTNFVKIIENKRAEKNILQVAYFQLAELIYNLIKKKFDPHKYVQKYVIPLLDKAYEVDQDSAAAVDIFKRKDEILIAHKIHPYVMVNGRKVSRKDIVLNFQGTYSQDDNVTLETDLASTTATEKASAIYNVDAFISRRWIHKKRYTLTPEFRISYTRYAEQNVPEIFQNDTISYAPAIRTSIDHKFYGKEATFLFDYEYNTTKRDINQSHKLEKFSDTSAYSIGQRIKLLKRGDTTFKMKFETSDNFDDAADATATIFSIDHAEPTRKGNLLLFLFQAKYETVQDSLFSTDSFLFRADYLIPQMWGGKWGLNFGAALTFLDTKEQSEARDLEKNFNPSLKLSRYIGPRFELSLL